MKKIKLLPSLMCADFRNLEKEIIALEHAGITSFHIDIMDGSFVPNFAMGLHDIQALRQITQNELDVHLMIVNPENHIDLFLNQGINCLSFHYEATHNAQKLLQKIKSKGVNAGLAINPDTPIEKIRFLLNDCDFIIVMTVFPGFAGQIFINYTKNKISEIRAIDSKISIMMDGAISAEKIFELSGLGADSFVLGTSALFNKNIPYDVLISDIYKMYYTV
ncbi:MAG: ribulose-phosphate 3-epimerase [Brevinema sp.]